MAKTSYSELLKDPRWQKKRLEILERDGWRCGWCDSSTKTLHVHHKAYKPGCKPWEYENDWLMAVCEDCHQFEYEDRSNAEAKILHTFRMAGLSFGDLHEMANLFPLNLGPVKASDVMCCLAWLVRDPEEVDILLAKYRLPVKGSRLPV